MGKKKKIWIALAALVVVALVVFVSIQGSRKNVATVQTGKVTRGPLTSIVSGSGEIKPKTYVNVGANAFGKIVRLHVKEGEQVKKGQLLAQLENVQSAAEVAAQRAGVQASQTDAAAADAAMKTAVAEQNRARAELQRTRSDFERAEGLFNDKLISKAEYDTRRAAYEAAEAGLAQADARIAQMRAQRESAVGRISQARASLARVSDQLSKTTYVAPFDGVVTNLPVREGETVVVGIQNSPGSTLMTIADMSIITAEVKVDETDIVHIKLGQPAEVTIDAVPNKTFKGTVTEIGNNAVIRSTGVSTSQTTSGSQEAKDFKVVVTLNEPPANLRPGLSTTAKITTDSRDNALVIPIQALTVRDKADLEQPKPGSKNAVQAAAPPRKKQELQGVFVIRGEGRNRRVEFVEVQTGIMGTTEIEVISGLKEGDEIVTGSYKVLRNLKNGAGVKIDNSAPKRQEES